MSRDWRVRAAEDAAVREAARQAERKQMAVSDRSMLSARATNLHPHC